jgi:voltage-gated sodium channel
LVNRLKRLRIIMAGLARGFNSVSYIMLLLLLVYYMYGVVGVAAFRRNDPFHFGSIGMAMLTLFQTATFDGWSNVVYSQSFGCNSQHNGVAGVSSLKICGTILNHLNCKH